MNIEVSIICNTYNHAQYIADAMNGFVNQITNFGFEILIHDDASTDSTQTIIHEFQDKYPDLIFPIYQKDNKYSKGINITKEYQLPRVKGKYIALCEGDDYWSDPYKLQKQYDIMECHPEIDMCANKAEQISAIDNSHIRWISPKNQNGVISLKDVVKGGGSYFATASLFFRKEIELNPPIFRSIYALDYTLQVSGALRNGIYYINDCMTVYRFFTAGSWTKLMRENDLKKIEHKKLMQKVFISMNRETRGKFGLFFVKEILVAEIKIVYLKIRSIF